MHTFASREDYSKYLIKRKKENVKIRAAYELLDESYEEDDDKNIEKIIKDTSLSPQEYIEVIALSRRAGYKKSTGSGNVSAEHQTNLMYGNIPWKFVEEFLQNADDCRYEDSPQITINVDEKASTIEFAYNETGFSREDIWSLTAFEQSTKSDEIERRSDIIEEGIFYKEKTGRKGIGFKSVFVLDPDADNIRVHICSNGFSFCLDKSIGTVIPIWEEASFDDGMTHVTIELVNPKLYISEIYPRFKEYFCIENLDGIFQKNPILFMHRIRDIRVRHIDQSGNEESFKISKEFSNGLCEYVGAFNPVQGSDILSGIFSNEQYYHRQYASFNIRIESSTGKTIVVPCLRETQMSLLDSKYRALSIVAPIMKTDGGNTWRTGSLFRTFQMIDNTFDLPFAIDAPFELNTARRGIEYTDLTGARTFNRKIIAILFGDGAIGQENTLLTDFMLYLRKIEGIRIDLYFNKAETILFANDANKNTSGKRLIPEVNLSKILRKLPVFALYGEAGYAPLEGVTSVVPELFNWLDAKEYLNLFISQKDVKLADVIYADSRVLRHLDTVELTFAECVNGYLDILEQRYGIDNTSYLSFVGEWLYPFLKNHYDKLKKNKSYNTLKVFFSRLKTVNGELIVRETCLNGWWFNYSGINNLSMGHYRIFESSPVDLTPLRPVIMDMADLKDLGDEFDIKNLQKSSKIKCTTWEATKEYLEALRYYYGYQQEDLAKEANGKKRSILKIKILEEYAVPEKLDTKKSNLYRQAGLLKVIPEDDINELAITWEGTNKTVNLLYFIGLRVEGLFGIPHGDSYVELREDAIRLFQSSNEDCAIPYIKSIYKHCTNPEKRKRIFLTYEDFARCSIGVQIELLRDKNMIAEDNYSSICKGILEDANFWKTDSNQQTEVLIRARGGVSKYSASAQKQVSISIRYIIENGLERMVQDILTKHHFDVIRIMNDGFFEEVQLDDILSMIRFLAPEKANEIEGKKNLHFYKGDLSALPTRDRYLVDGSGQSVFMHNDEKGNYNASLERYLNTSFDPEAITLMADLEKQVHGVYEKYIRQTMQETENDFHEAYHVLRRGFEGLTKQEQIEIISWFRRQGYSASVGNAAISNEKEIEKDYKNDPWRFVFEFIQNIDDCDYLIPKIYPTVAITIDEYNNSLSFLYNETGFTLEDIEALTAFGSSNKSGMLDTHLPEKGVFDLEKTGRMGRGFKSVFALSGKDIVVTIESNGYSFRLYKRLGQIIPVWFNPEEGKMPQIGTRITIEGLQEGGIDVIYDKLRNVFCINDINDFFADCPLLYLRKLKTLFVQNGKRHFIVSICSANEHAKTRYSETEFDTAGLRIYSGIKQYDRYCMDAWEHFSIELKDFINDNEITTNIRAVRYSRMFKFLDTARTVSFTAPVLTGHRGRMFNKGSLFKTLPLKGNRFGLPFAINAPFLPDTGREKVANDSKNQKIMDVIFSEMLPAFYEYIRGIDGISLEDYILIRDDRLFTGYQYLRQINLKTYTDEQEVFRLYNSDGYVSRNRAVLLPAALYKWQSPEILAEIFFPNAGEALVEPYYSVYRNTLMLNEIALIDLDFVKHLNQYLNAVEQLNETDMADLLRSHILPYITDNYDAIRRTYRAENRTDELKQMRIFLFRMADGQTILESAEGYSIWMTECPSHFASYGNYRCLDTSSTGYTHDQLKWLTELHELIPFYSAFTKDKLDLRGVDSWEKAKTLIETLLYYGVEGKAQIPFLKKCVLSETYDNTENVFRDAYLDTQDDKIAEYYISDDDIQGIADSSCNILQKSAEEIADLIIRAGVRKGDDFFEGPQRALQFNEETLYLFCSYCRTVQHAEKVLSAVSNALTLLVNKKTSSVNLRLSLELGDIKGCAPIFFSQLLKSDILDQSDKEHIARDYYNTPNVERTTAPDAVEALLIAASLQKAGKLVYERELIIPLSEIYSRKLGRCIQDVMKVHDDKIRFSILTDLPINEYPGDNINKALSWLRDSDYEQETASKMYHYYYADISEAFESGTDKKQMYLLDSEKVVLHAPVKNDQETREGSALEKSFDISFANITLLSFVHAQYKGKDDSYKSLIDIIQWQEELKHWKDSKRAFIQRLKRYRETSSGLGRILYPNLTENINRANSSSYDYIIPELLQNINDCKYSEPEKGRQLLIEMDTKSGIMKLSYDEDGFDFQNVYSITALGQSSKHDMSEGEKGLGFKKVFTLFDKVHIYSNGFCFSLTRNKPTIPDWIPDMDNASKAQGRTTMIFYTEQRRDFARIASQWKELFNPPYESTKVSPIFLDNIAQYELLINDTEQYSITRKDILKGYHIVSMPLLSSFFELLPEETTEEQKNELHSSIAEDLRKRTKCSVMTDDEFQTYIDNINIRVCFPRKLSRRDVQKNMGCFYSTLPTETLTHLSLHINLPLELTTGRNNVLQESPYNKRIFELAFHGIPEGKSVFGHILETAALELPEQEMFLYFGDGVDEWTEYVSYGYEIKKRRMLSELKGLRILHAYPDNALISVEGSYSIDYVVYQYMLRVDSVQIDFRSWSQSHCKEISGMNLVNIRKDPAETVEALEKFARDIKANTRNYPVSQKYPFIVYDYLIGEYNL